MTTMRPVPDASRCINVAAKTGERCRNAAQSGKDICVSHDPEQRLPPDDKRCTMIMLGISRPENKGERCTNWSMQGQHICSMHGGKSPHNKRAAAVRIADRQLTEQASALVGRPVANPLTELARLAGRARALVEVLEVRVEALFDADSDGRCPHCDGDLAEAGGSGAGGGIRYKGGAGEQVRGEVQLYERAMDRLGRILADIGRLDIDNRLAKISSRQADAVIAAIEAGLAAAGVREPAQRSLAKNAASKELRMVR